MFWLDTINGDLKVRQAAALCWTKILLSCPYWNLRCGRLPHAVSQLRRHCPSQVQCVEPGLSDKPNSSTRNEGLQLLSRGLDHCFLLLGPSS